MLMRYLIHWMKSYARYLNKMNKDRSIIILICYYGEFPWYFKYFLHSCKYNKDIDYYIFTDNDYQYELPENVTIIKMSMAKIKKLISEKVGFTVNIDFPYKLCDFKPAYGLIFLEFVEDYDFWGYSDIDIIYGDIRNFINGRLLNEFEYISLRHDYTTGCFSLFRNDPSINNLFKNSKDYKKVFSSSKHFCFDECNFTQNLLATGKSIFEVDTEIESFTHVIRSAEKNKQIRVHFDFLLMEGIPGKIKFDHGKIFYKNTFEAILYHLY